MCYSLDDISTRFRRLSEAFASAVVTLIRSARLLFLQNLSEEYKNWSNLTQKAFTKNKYFCAQQNIQ